MSPDTKHVSVFVRMDLHNHLVQPTVRTIKSDLMNPDEVIDIASQRLSPDSEGKGVLGIASFDGYPRYQDFISISGKYNRVKFENGIFVPEKGLYVVNVQEVLGKEGHVLICCLPEKLVIKDGTCLDEIIKIAENEGAFLVTDHPFFEGGLGPVLKRNQEKYLPYFAAGEIYNSRAAIFPFANQRAEKFLREMQINGYKIGVLSSSDAGSVKAIGRSSSLVYFADFGEIKSGEELSRSLEEGVRIGSFTSLGEDIRTPARLEALLHIAHMIRTEGPVSIAKRALGFASGKK